jgi:ABC-type polysaccharide/polyol phosphate transport system ATPase subunit
MDTHISIKDLSVEFRVYGAHGRSLKRRIFSQMSGGEVSAGEGDSITVKALNHIDLEFNHGDRVGLIGHNGSGKSTLLRVIAGIYKPTTGSIRTTGTVGALLDPAAGMDVEATGIENIYLSGYMLGMTKAELDERLDDISEFTGLGNFIYLPVKTYSAGMYARLAFAISTSINPDILIIDEGIGAGDDAFMQKARRRTEEMLTTSGIFVIATHDQNLIKSFCNRTIRLEAGNIVSIDSI